MTSNDYLMAYKVFLDNDKLCAIVKYVLMRCFIAHLKVLLHTSLLYDQTLFPQALLKIINTALRGSGTVKSCGQIDQ